MKALVYSRSHVFLQDKCQQSRNVLWPLGHIFDLNINGDSVNQWEAAQKNISCGVIFSSCQRKPVFPSSRPGPEQRLLSTSPLFSQGYWGMDFSLRHISLYHLLDQVSMVYAHAASRIWYSLKWGYSSSGHGCCAFLWSFSLPVKVSFLGPPAPPRCYPFGPLSS